MVIDHDRHTNVALPSYLNVHRQTKGGGAEGVEGVRVGAPENADDHKVLQTILTNTVRVVPDRSS